MTVKPTVGEISKLSDDQLVQLLSYPDTELSTRNIIISELDHRHRVKYPKDESDTSF